MSLIHTTIEQLFDEIAEAIRVQEGSSALIVADNFPKRIRGLATLDTSDATATSSTILSGYTAYANGTKITGNYIPLDTSDASANATMIQSGETAYVNGVKITGTLPVTSSFSFPLTSYGPAAVSETPAAIVLSLNNPTKTIVEANSPIALQAALPSFGRVSEADVIAGQTFTSTAGLNKTGTFTIDTEISDQQDLIQQIQEALVGKSAGAGGVTLPTLSNPGAAEDLKSGKELIDANGNIVIGTAEESQPTVGVGSHFGSGYYISENAEGTLKPVTVPSSNCFAVSGVVNMTDPSQSGAQFSIHNLYLDTKLNLANAINFFIPALAYQSDGLINIYGFRDNEGWTIYYYGLLASNLPITAMMRSDEILMISGNNNRAQHQGNMFTTSFVDNGKIPLLPLSTSITQSSTELLNMIAFMSDYVNYNGIPVGPDIIITYAE